MTARLHPTHTPVYLAFLSLALLSACSTVPAPNARLTQAQTDLRTAQNDPRTTRLAAAELQQAQESFNTAHAAWEREDAPDTITHLAYLARQRVAIARETVALRSAEQASGTAGSTRSHIQLEARTQEANSAQRHADNAQYNADRAQRQTEQAQHDAQIAQQRTDKARAEAAESQRQTDVAHTQNLALQERLRELNAKPSPQGIMLTLGDVLFDTDKAQLKPAGLHLVHQLAAVLNEYPLHHARVEGFTDSTGSEAHNRTLSGQRAESVRLALMSQGVASARITARGHGETNPIAGNDSADGRAMNRRVEIILSTGLGLISVDVVR